MAGNLRHRRLFGRFYPCHLHSIPRMHQHRMFYRCLAGMCRRHTVSDPGCWCCTNTSWTNLGNNVPRHRSNKMLPWPEDIDPSNTQCPISVCTRHWWWWRYHQPYHRRYIRHYTHTLLTCCPQTLSNMNHTSYRCSCNLYPLSPYSTYLHYTYLPYTGR